MGERPKNVYAHFPPFGEEKEKPKPKPHKAKRRKIKQTIGDIIRNPLTDMTKEEQQEWLLEQEEYLFEE